MHDSPIHSGRPDGHRRARDTHVLEVGSDRRIHEAGVQEVSDGSGFRLDQELDRSFVYGAGKGI
jgi:hypothetical protein